MQTILSFFITFLKPFPCRSQPVRVKFAFLFFSLSLQNPPKRYVIWIHTYVSNMSIFNFSPSFSYICRVLRRPNSHIHSKCIGYKYFRENEKISRVAERQLDKHICQSAFWKYFASNKFGFKPLCLSKTYDATLWSKHTSINKYLSIELMSNVETVQFGKILVKNNQRMLKTCKCNYML